MSDKVVAYKYNNKRSYNSMSSTTDPTGTTSTDNSNDNNLNNNNDIDMAEIIKKLPRDCIKCDSPDCMIYNHVIDVPDAILIIIVL